MDAGKGNDGLSMRQRTDLHRKRRTVWALLVRALTLMSILAAIVTFLDVVLGQQGQHGAAGDDGGESRAGSNGVAGTKEGMADMDNQGMYYGDGDFPAMVRLMKAMVAKSHFTHAFDHQRQHDIMPPLLFSKEVIAADDIVMATHVSCSKLNVLLKHLEWWGGPTSIALYANSVQDVERYEAFINQHAQALERAVLAFVLENTRLYYPFSILRNVALENVRSDYFFAMDVDFLPSANAYEGMRALIQEDREQVRTNLQRKVLYVLPALQLFPIKNQSYALPESMPLSKRQALTMMDDERIQPFHYRLIKGETWDVIRANRGHESTNYRRWMRETEAVAYDIERLEDRFEPYVLVYKPGVPPYYGAFRGWGLNKVSWFREMWCAEYTYKVFRDFYVVHLDHPVKKRIQETGPHQFLRVWDDLGVYLTKAYDRKEDPTLPKRLPAIWDKRKNPGFDYEKYKDLTSYVKKKKKKGDNIKTRK